MVIWLLLGVVSAARTLKIVDTSAMAGSARHMKQQPHWSCIDGKCQAWSKGLFDSALECEKRSPECRPSEGRAPDGGGASSKHSSLYWLLHPQEKARLVEREKARSVHESEARVRGEKEAKRTSDSLNQQMATGGMGMGMNGAAARAFAGSGPAPYGPSM